MINDKFSFKVTKEPDKTIVQLDGAIDEDTVFDELHHLDSPVIFDFKNVTSINSCGIRTWVNFLKDLGTKKVFYMQCPPLIVRQMNMVPSFMGNATVLSVFVPYVCDKCESEKLVKVGSEQFKSNLEDAMKCDQCNEGDMELDGHPQQYFAFAK